MNARSTLLIAISAISFVVSSSAAFSQVQSDESTGLVGNSGEFGEIIVTAQKRNESINQIGMTISAFSGDTLKNRQVSNIQDLSSMIPGLSFTRSSTGSPVYSLRGVGFYESSLSAYPAVSVYVDEAPLSFPALTKHAAFDLERVEILKGPQGTLFGQNSTGGAINFIAAKPTDHLAAALEVGLARFNTVTAEGYLSGPLASNLTGRVAFRIEHGGDWQRSNTRPDDSLGRTRSYIGRMLLDFKPADGWRFQLNVNGWKDKSDPLAMQFTALQPGIPGFETPELLAQRFSPETSRAADWNLRDPHASNDLVQAVLRTDVDLSDQVVLTLMSNYVRYNQRQRVDADGLPISLSDLPVSDGEIRSFSQEARISNGNAGHFRWIVGGNFERSTVDEDIDIDWSNSTTYAFYATFGYPIRDDSAYSKQKIKTYAVFANGELDVSNNISVKAGVRYTLSDRRTRNCTYSKDAAFDSSGVFVYDFILGGAFGPYVPGTCWSLNTFSYTLNGVPSGFPGEYVDRLKEDNVSWRVGLDWKPTSRVLGYVNVARGNKAGSFPTVGALALSQNFPVVQESVLAYEAGFKAMVVDRLLRVNGAAFFYDYKNKQTRAKLIDPLIGPLDQLQNIPKSSVRGAEMEVIMTPIPGVVANVSATYAKAKIDEFVGISDANTSADFAGTRVPFTPKLQIGANLDYATDLSDRLKIGGGAGINHRSSTIAFVGGDLPPPGLVAINDKPFVVKGYSTVDVRAYLEAGDRWKVQLWGKNIFNKYYWMNVQRSGDVSVRYPAMPATYGITFTAYLR